MLGEQTFAHLKASLSMYPVISFQQQIYVCRMCYLLSKTESSDQCNTPQSLWRCHQATVGCVCSFKIRLLQWLTLLEAGFPTLLSKLQKFMAECLKPHALCLPKRSRTILPDPLFFGPQIRPRSQLTMLPWLPVEQPRIEFCLLCF